MQQESKALTWSWKVCAGRDPRHVERQNLAMGVSGLSTTHGERQLGSSNQLTNALAAVFIAMMSRDTEGSGCFSPLQDRWPPPVLL